MEVGEGSSKDEFEGGGAPGEEFSKDDPVGTHTISVTQGADLKAAVNQSFYALLHYLFILMHLFS